MICPAFCTTHGPCDSHILPVSPSHDDIVDRMTVLRAVVHPGYFVTSREAEYSVGYLKILIGPGMKQEVVAVAVRGGAALSNSCIKVTKNDELVCSSINGNNIFKVFIELVFCLICVGHGGCLGADDGSELFTVMKWKSHSHEAVIHSFRGAG